MPLAACAKSKPLAVGAVTFAKLGVNEPAIIISNPFYGFTNLVHGVKETMNTEGSDKVALRADQLNRKAAELIKMRSVAPDRVKLLSQALGEYQFAVYQYAFAINRLTPDDVTGGEFAYAQTQTMLMNLRLIDDLLASVSASSDQAVLTDLADRLSASASYLFTGVIGLANITTYVLSMSAPFDLVRNAEMFALLAKQAAGQGENDLAKEFLAIRTELLNAFIAGQTESEIDITSQFEALSGTAAERIQTLSYLLTIPMFADNAHLISARNLLLIKVFSR